MNYDIIEVVVDKLVRTFGLREWQEDMDIFVEDIAEALKLIGAAKVFSEVTIELPVNGRIVKLPLDCENIMHLIPTAQHYQEHGGFIVVDKPDGTVVTLKYQAMPLDTRGWPLVPDNAAVREAIMWFLVKNLTLRGEVNKITFQMAEQEWQWRCLSARGDLNAMSLQGVNKVYNDFVRLNPIKDQHLKDYVGVGKHNTLDREKYRDNPLSYNS
jgi:hypothetical protein